MRKSSATAVSCGPRYTCPTTRYVDCARYACAWPSARLHGGPRRLRVPRFRATERVAVASVSWRRGGTDRLECRAPGIGTAHGPNADAGDRPAEAALSPGVCTGLGPVVLGLVLASGVRLGLPHRRPAAVRIRLRYAPQLVTARHLHIGFRTVPRHFQHQPVPLFQAGLVLLAVPPGGARLRRQRTDPLGQGRPARTHLQPLVVSTRRVFAWIDTHG
jgi:hypothetical protein